jgi:hypothetical protein
MVGTWLVRHETGFGYRSLVLREPTTIHHQPWLATLNDLLNLSHQTIIHPGKLSAIFVLQLRHGLSHGRGGTASQPYDRESC